VVLIATARTQCSAAGKLKHVFQELRR